MFYGGINLQGAAIFLAVTYFIWGFWIVTVRGLLACWRLLRAQPRRQLGWGLLAASMAPFALMGLLAGIGVIAPEGVDLGVLGLAGLSALNLLASLAGPLAACRAEADMSKRATIKRDGSSVTLQPAFNR